jgi:hypothetical protein
VLLGGVECGIELVSVRFAEDKHVDVPYRPLTGMPFVPGGPGSVDVRLGNPVNIAQDFGQDGGDAEGSDQHLSQPRVIGTNRVARTSCVFPTLRERRMGKSSGAGCLSTV